MRRYRACGPLQTSQGARRTWTTSGRCLRRRQSRPRTPAMHSWPWWGISQRWLGDAPPALWRSARTQTVAHPAAFSPRVDRQRSRRSCASSTLAHRAAPAVALSHPGRRVPPRRPRGTENHWARGAHRCPLFRPVSNGARLRVVLRTVVTPLRRRCVACNFRRPRRSSMKKAK